jgi:hypothetical protein
MSFDCSRLEEALREEDSELLDAAREHAAGCEACRAELESWHSFTATLSSTAKELKHEWESPDLWTRIDAALPLRPQAQPAQRRVLGDWRLFTTGAAVVLLTVASAWLAVRPARRQPQPQALRQPPSEALKATLKNPSRQFLTEQALKEVQRNEVEYVRSLDRLVKLAGPALDADPSQLMASYREKLTLLDAAIADLRENRAHNMLNANLNTELLSLYQEKQKTLHEVIQYASQSN